MNPQDVAEDEIHDLWIFPLRLHEIAIPPPKIFKRLTLKKCFFSLIIRTGRRASWQSFSPPGKFKESVN